MTLYLDTSSLVKLYVEEADSTAIAHLVDAASVVATSVVAYAEARAAFGRRRRERLLTAAASALATRHLDLDWPAFLTLDVTEPLGRSAGRLADRFGLRGFDAIHLASAQRLMMADLSFVTFDLRQGQAARTLGMHVLGC